MRDPLHLGYSDDSDSENEDDELWIVPDTSADTIEMSSHAEGLRRGLPEVTSGDIDRLSPPDLVAAAGRIAVLAAVIVRMTVMPTRVDPPELARARTVPAFEYGAETVSPDGTVRLSLDCSGMREASFCDEFHGSLRRGQAP